MSQQESCNLRNRPNALADQSDTPTSSSSTMSNLSSSSSINKEKGQDNMADSSAGSGNVVTEQETESESFPWKKLGASDTVTESEGANREASSSSGTEAGTIQLNRCHREERETTRKSYRGHFLVWFYERLYGFYLTCVIVGSLTAFCGLIYLYYTGSDLFTWYALTFFFVCLVLILMLFIILLRFQEGGE